MSRIASSYTNFPPFFVFFLDLHEVCSPNPFASHPCPTFNMRQFSSYFPSFFQTTIVSILKVKNMFNFFPYTHHVGHISLSSSIFGSDPPCPRLLPWFGPAKEKEKEKTILIGSSNECLNFKKLLRIPFAQCTLRKKAEFSFPEDSYFWAV